MPLRKQIRYNSSAYSISGVAVLFCYINQASFFTACIAINEKRVEENRHIIVCCKTVKSAEYKNSRGKTFCCGGKKPRDERDVDSYLERFPKFILPGIVKLKMVKIAILLCFTAYLGVAIWGVVNLDQGLVIKNLVSDSSYFYKFTDWDENKFSKEIPIMFATEQTVEYHTASVQNEYKKLSNLAHSNKFLKNISINWLEEYEASSFFNSASEVTFISGLKQFLADRRFQRFTNDIRFSASNDSIVASRFYIFSRTILDSQDQGEMMMCVRDIASKVSQFKVTAFAPPFIFYEQYVEILPQTLQTLGTSLVAVFLVTVFFMPHPLLLLYIIITIGMILTGIVGFMSHEGLTLSSITMIHLIMSVGFSIDYTSHTCHAYMVAVGNTRKERVRIALQSSGAPIFNGAVSSILGIVMLAFAKSYIFQSFFKVMFLVVLFGICHAVFFLPSLLSFIGPHSGEMSPYRKRVSPARNGVSSGSQNVAQRSKSMSDIKHISNCENGCRSRPMSSGYVPSTEIEPAWIQLALMVNNDRPKINIELKK